MKRFILAAVLAMTATLAVANHPAKAAYISPDATWEQKALCIKGC